ncbi:MAG: hypothetical protein A3B68_02155 [Candidatus Melainabacteria bacterium RIFCSPHIGHO2_02_FULL_34_12]|nr:MAG: hypothetical protein A3B68_02155 [Candidatus Melainabacteria bacterium RIFCSPHIGHO2_02_FULL_34_12]
MSALKNVSNEEKLKATKDIVVAYINSSVKKKGDDQEPTLKPEHVCDLLKKVFKTMEEILPLTETRMGL